MKYTTIKGTTIAGDVPCETDGWVRKADLHKIVENVHRNEPEESDDVLDHAIHNGRMEVVMMIENLLSREDLKI